MILHNKLLASLLTCSLTVLDVAFGNSLAFGQFFALSGVSLDTNLLSAFRVALELF